MSLLRELSGHPEYVALLKEAQKARPSIPPWSIDSTNGTDNADEWKRKSAMQEGFDLALLFFTPR